MEELKVLKTSEMLAELLKDPDNLEAYQDDCSGDRISFIDLGGFKGTILCWDEGLGHTPFAVRPYDTASWIVVKKEVTHG